MQDAKTHSQDRFNRFAEGYITSQTHAKGAELARLVEIAAPQSDWVALDVATGGGHTALAFAPHVARVTATDIASNMLTKARDFITGQGVTNVDFREADAESLPFDDATFNLVTCRIAPHHFPDVGLFVREAARVLKKGGTLLVQDQVVPKNWITAAAVNAYEKLHDPSHNRALPESEWHTHFQNAGLRISHTEQITKRHDLNHWASMQGCDEATVAELLRRLQTAPDDLAAWLEIDGLDGDAPSFVNHHILIAGLRSD